MCSYQAPATASDPGKVQVSVFNCLSSLGSCDFPCDFNSLTDLRRVVNFQFLQLFSCEDGNDNFQALYMLDQKL